jgi:hypothetical protein
MFSLNLKLRTSFGNSCNVNPCDVNVMVIVSLTHLRVRKSYLILCIGGLSGCYPTGEGIIPFEARWSPREWTRVLEPV